MAIAAAVTVVAILLAFGILGGDPRTRTLIILALTLAAIVWYTAFTYMATRQAQESARLTEMLAEFESVRLHAQRAETLPRLRRQLNESRDRQRAFLKTGAAKLWAEGKQHASHPGVHPVDLGHIDSTWRLAALQDERVRNSVRPLLALLDSIHELDAEIGADSNFHVETEARKAKAKKLVADTKLALKRTEEALEAVTAAIRVPAG